MELSVVAGVLMKAAVEMSGLNIEDDMMPNYVVMTQKELVSDLCVKGKEYQCDKYLTFSPPMTNKIILSSNLHPETSIKDQSIIFHENLKYLLYINGKENPNYSCERNYSTEAKIFKIQMQFIATQMSRGETGAKFSADDVMKMDKGSYMTWCNPNIKESEPELPKFGPLNKPLDRDKML